ncbi:NADP-dependent oxidoreductase [Nocardia sp. NBC_00511]|uniref:NADP-dependent oxidoreductase n=1 Tax=Nocardia sp. NBC_00511 TaxID=2903591 RepID=UPI002F917EA3
MTKAVVFDTYGDPEVLHIADVPTRDPGPGELLVAVAATGVQPFDALFRSGGTRQFAPATFPQRLGNEFAGTVAGIGAGVEDFSLGDEVLGWADRQSYAEYVVVPATQAVGKPASMPWSAAGVLSASGQTASTALDILDVKQGETLLVHAAAGGVGSYAVQLAVARGATVIGTASIANHAYLEKLGAIPVSYGEGLSARLHTVAPEGINASLVAIATREAFATSAELVHDGDRVATVAFSPVASEYRVRAISTDRSRARLQHLVDAYTAGTLVPEIQHAYPLDNAAEAHRAIETGHVRGKLVLTVS